MGNVMLRKMLMASVSAFWLSGSFMAAYAAANVTATTGETGSVIVVRGGETFSLLAGDQLFDGDRIVTRAGATVDITTDGCTRTIPEISTIVVDGAFCEAVFASAEETILADAGGISQGGGMGAAMPLAALGGLAVAAAASGGKSGGKGKPSSP